MRIALLCLAEHSFSSQRKVSFVRPRGERSFEFQVSSFKFSNRKSAPSAFIRVADSLGALGVLVVNPSAPPQRR